MSFTPQEQALITAAMANGGLTTEERDLIVGAIDKSDYTRMGSLWPRFIDLDTIVAEVVADKAAGGYRKLTGITLVSQRQSYPPQNEYEYEYE